MKTITGKANRILGLFGKATPVALALSLSLNVWAAGGSGTTGAEFLKIGVGARGVAMGGAMAAVQDDAHALYWNPAAAAQNDAPRLDASYNNLYQDANQGFVGFVAPARKGVWGVGIDYLQISKIERRLSDTASPDYTFTSKDSELLLSYSHPDLFMDGLALGTNLKYVQSYLDNGSAHAFAADFGALYQPKEQPWSLGATFQNFGTGLKYVNATESLPLVVRFGGAYRLFENKLLVAAAMDSWLRNQRTFGDLGLEYRPVKWVAVRGGYQLGHGQDQLGGSLVGFSTGVGFQFKHLNLDYAYVPFGDLGSTQRFSLGFKFGEGDDDVHMKSH